jgi:uncharacterized protein YcbK (DUF882 family)
MNRRSFLKIGTFVGIASSQRIVAAGSGERALSFYNLHTTESLRTVYWAEGNYIPEALTAINYHLRDYRTGDTHEIDRRLLDVLCELRKKLETSSPLEVISGYRSPVTNAMLHANSSGVAEHSLHIEGMAADIRIAGRNLLLLRRTAISLKAGGVGYYPTSDFVHVDVGRVRTW